MRICVLQSSYDGVGDLQALQEVDTVFSQPGKFTSFHTFENHFIHKATAQQEIDALAAKGFDFFINFLWGTPDDPVAGAKESRYFESLGLPSCGIRSWERYMTKNAFYQNARRRGAPPVPGTDGFPLFVKPANGCSGQLIDETSVCHDQAELEGALRQINKALFEARVRRAEAEGIEDTEAFAGSYDPVGRDSDDIVVQDYIEGDDFTCSVIEMGGACIALIPFIYKTKETNRVEKFLTFELKYDDETRTELFHKKQNPGLFDSLQQVAVEAFMASGCKGSNMGCNVDMRAQPNGKVFAIEVNPQPADFVPKGPCQGLPITHGLPGGHTAIVDIFIANQLLQTQKRRDVTRQVAATFDGFAPEYDNPNLAPTAIEAGIEDLVQQHDYSGTIFDLGCGTGALGHALAKSKFKSTLIGFDISPGMLEICKKHGQYTAVHVEYMEAALVNHRRYAERVDHITSFSALQFLRPEIVSFVLVLCFALADKSISFSVDEIPDRYNENLKARGCTHMCTWNHLERVAAIGEPLGWRLTERKRQFAWTSPATGDEVFATYFRFDRVGDTEMLFQGPELLN